MKKKPCFIGCLAGIALLLSSITYAAQIATTTLSSSATKNVVDERANKEKKLTEFSVNFYKPTYILPFNYTTSPYKAIYQNQTPDNQSLESAEVKFQFSFKIPVWQDVFKKSAHPSNLYLAYTQLSYWQVYNRSAFFRESNYQPEIFLATKFDWHLWNGWQLNFVNIGADHQSNGRGGDMERSWNRIYLEGIVGKENWMLSLKSWSPIWGATMKYNPDIPRYLGYEQLVASYKYQKNVFSVEARNTIESGFSRGAIEASWSFPLTRYINGFVQTFSGYGQSLLEYDHYTNSIGVGIALSNWI
jgi:phospholipase A1